MLLLCCKAPITCDNIVDRNATTCSGAGLYTKTATTNLLGSRCRPPCRLPIPAAATSKGNSEGVPVLSVQQHRTPVLVVLGEGPGRHVPVLLKPVHSHLDGGHVHGDAGHGPRYPCDPLGVPLLRLTVRSTRPITLSSPFASAHGTSNMN